MTLTTTLGRAVQAVDYYGNVPYKERLEELFGTDPRKVDLAEAHAYWVTYKENATDPFCTDSTISRLAAEEKVAANVWTVAWFVALAVGEMDSEEFKAEREEQKKLFLSIVG